MTANDFYEDDEPVEDVLAAFEAGEHAVTARPDYTKADATSYEHARDITDADFLTAVFVASSQLSQSTVTRQAVANVLTGRDVRSMDDEAPIPDKIVIAKAKRVIGRGLLKGCTCGCRGDFELTTAGMTFVDG